MRRSLLIFVTIIFASVACLAQTEASQKDKKVAATGSQAGFRSSPAYAELLLKRTELSASLESLILEYTEEFPKVKEDRFVLTLIDRETDRLSKMKPPDMQKLTLALGKLIVRKIELETELWNLQKNYKDEHPDVKRSKRKVEIYESAIGEILN